MRAFLVVIHLMRHLAAFFGLTAAESATDNDDNDNEDDDDDDQ